MMALVACLALPAASRADTCSVSGTNILKNGSVWVGGGVNAFDQFGISGKTGWGIRIVREVVDDFSECPIAGSEGTRATSLGYLHPLEDVVKNNRGQGMITILCPFGWDATRYTQILGATPSAEPWYAAFKARLAVVARRFASQPDVWIEVWNEPYAWDNAGFTERQWSRDMTDLYNVIRLAGNSNIVLVPGQAEGGQETVLVHQGSFLTGKTNVVATIHCYNRWTGGTQAAGENRIRAVRAAGWALIFGEVGPDAWVSDCTRLLNASVTQQVPSLAWSWNAGDGSTLVKAGAATAWGKQFFRYLPQYGSLQSATTVTSPGRNSN